MNQNRKKNTVTESEAEAKLKGFLDMIAHPLSSFTQTIMSAETPTAVCGHLGSIRRQRMSRRY